MSTYSASQRMDKPSTSNQEYQQMLYYQAGDIVFAKHMDFLWPSKVVKPFNNYTEYKVFLFEIKLHICFSMKNLIDYTPSNRQKSIKMFQLHERDDITRQKFFLGLRAANTYYKEQKRKEEEEAKRKQEHKKIQSQSEQNNQIKNNQQQNKAIIQHKDLERPRKRKQRPFKFSREIKNIVIDSPYLSEAYQRTKMQQGFSLHHQFSINHEQIISQQKKQCNPPFEFVTPLNEAGRLRPQYRRMRQKILDRSLNRQFGYFISQKNIARKDELIVEDKEMMTYVSLYQTILEELDLHLESLSTLPQSVCIKVCENTLDKIFKALTQSKPKKFHTVSFLPLLKAIFEKQLITIQKIVSQGIFIRMLILIRTYKQLGCSPQVLKPSLEYLQEHCRELKIKYILGDECSMSVKQKMEEIFKKTTFED